MAVYSGHPGRTYAHCSGVVDVTQERDCTVLGMELDIGVNDPITTAQPLAAFVVVKALDSDGNVCYLTGATEGLPTVECLGMADFAMEKLRYAVRKRFR
jgi:hypothetical protein